MKKIVLIRCPQPLLIGEQTGAMYSPNRAISPEPTLPQLQGIINTWSKGTGEEVEVYQLDLRSPRYGQAKSIRYGNLTLPYLDEAVLKLRRGVPIDALVGHLEDADIIGFSNNFSMSRAVVSRDIATIRRMFPDKEIWVGGRDIYTQRVIDVYTEAAGSKNVVVFHGHVFESLPAYLSWKFRDEGQPFGVSVYNENGMLYEAREAPKEIPSRFAEAPIPVYSTHEDLGYFVGSGEGCSNTPFGRFVHATFSIGCPYADCGYCTTAFRERSMVCKSLKTIELEMEYYQDLGVTHLAIMDDNFLMLGTKRVCAIMKLVNQAGFYIEYGNGLQLSLLDRLWGKIAKLVFERCVSFYAPLEDLTVGQRYLKLHSTTDQLRLMKRIAVEYPGSLKYLTMGVVHGVPGHTLEGLRETFPQNVERFLATFSGSPLEVCMTVFNFIPLSGTAFGERAFDSKRIIVADPFRTDPEILSFGTVSYAPKGVTHREVFETYEHALNLNPAGKEIGVTYVKLQRYGEKALPMDRRGELPPNWRIPGYHLRARVK